MKKRIFIIHGWGGSPNNDWFPWAKEILIKKGYEVIVPEMPDTEHPKIRPWVDTLDKVVGEPRESDIFIGHSVGCQTILRYLEKLGEGKKVNKVVMIAPWWYLTLENLDSDKRVAYPWMKSLINFGNVIPKVKKLICVFSDNDPFVPLKSNVEFFRAHLHPEIMTKNNAGHFLEDDGFEKAEFILDLI